MKRVKILNRPVGIEVVRIKDGFQSNTSEYQNEALEASVQQLDVDLLIISKNTIGDDS